MDENDETCPGSAVCRDTRGMPLNKYADRPEDEVCGGCKLRPTKTEDAPFGAADATELFTLQKAGARFDYPNGLLPYEWAAMTGLQQGHSAAETERQRRNKRKNRT